MKDKKWGVTLQKNIGKPFENTCLICQGDLSTELAMWDGLEGLYILAEAHMEAFDWRKLSLEEQKKRGPKNSMSLGLAVVLGVNEQYDIEAGLVEIHNMETVEFFEKTLQPQYPHFAVECQCELKEKVIIEKEKNEQNPAETSRGICHMISRRINENRKELPEGQIEWSWGLQKTNQPYGAMRRVEEWYSKVITGPVRHVNILYNDMINLDDDEEDEMPKDVCPYCSWENKEDLINLLIKKHEEEVGRKYTGRQKMYYIIQGRKTGGRLDEITVEEAQKRKCLTRCERCKKEFFSKQLAWLMKNAKESMQRKKTVTEEDYQWAMNKLYDDKPQF